LTNRVVTVVPAFDAFDAAGNHIGSIGKPPYSPAASSSIRLVLAGGASDRGAAHFYPTILDCGMISRLERVRL
jgi:hypothetical protein